MPTEASHCIYFCNRYLLSTYYVSDSELCTGDPQVVKKSSYTQAKSLKSCQSLCNPMDCNPPGSSVLGISQARTLDGLSFPPLNPNSGIKPMSSVWQMDSSPLSHLGSPHDATRESPPHHNKDPAPPEIKTKERSLRELSDLPRAHSYEVTVVTARPLSVA